MRAFFGNGVIYLKIPKSTFSEKILEYRAAL